LGMIAIKKTIHSVFIQRAVERKRTHLANRGKAMTPDQINFQLTDEVSIGIGHGQVTLLVGNDWRYITRTNFGRFLLETQGWTGAQPVRALQCLETSGAIQ